MKLPSSVKSRVIMVFQYIEIFGILCVILKKYIFQEAPQGTVMSNPDSTRAQAQSRISVCNKVDGH